MAVNLPPQYHDAEAEYKKARTPEEKLVALKKMWVILPKHKASEKVQVILKTKISEVNDEIETIKSGPKKATASYKIPRQGAGTIVFLGGPNGGKSSLLRKLTKATPEVARIRSRPRADSGHDGLGRRSRSTHRPAADHGLSRHTSPTSLDGRRRCWSSIWRR